MAVESGVVTPSQGHTAARLRAGALVSLFVCGPLFLLFPQIDIAVASVFFAGDHRFVGNSASVEMWRNVFKSIYAGACILAVVGLAYTHFNRVSLWGRGSMHYLFLLTCLILGPGMVTNVVLKDQWGRARPREIVQFGGEKTFTAALLPSRQCHKNCSFVSGEASSMFMVFFAAAFMARRRARAFVLLGLTAGGLAGLVRMAQGGHFLSDVVFAGVAMALTAVFCYRLFVAYEPAFGAAGVRPG